jgi:hypothetical protein
MSTRKSDPDHVQHKSFWGAFLPIPGTEVHSTTITKSGNQYTGYGSSRSEADKKAGDRYRKGERDKK